VSQIPLPCQQGSVKGKYKERGGRKKGPLCNREKGSRNSNRTASIADCAAERCYYVITQAPLHWVIICTDTQTEKAIT